MAKPTIVKLDELERVFTRVLEVLRQSGFAEVELSNDYFWSIPDDQIYHVESPPHDLTIGQVSESLQWLTNTMLEDGDAIPYSLLWISDVLKALALQLSE
ncbi:MULTISPECIES: hypothetical protein [unclassified Cryobacterium]|uniref:hypothetical protein n=1 Tax=unclassified Cryobacterium TaxID=2649013 RepID=UPI002AB391F9|nr:MULTISPECIES: hypothetical protein [unclassified Cryobacterium]MDY7528883.1 hypothetical protein [Cryobacterium sp. 10C2]MDY7555376.1 hypothetical protein [Cryobacterium sp. 10C3]MEB0200694.1 hypothetical protein [Cryobacterium sp. 5I3]MEB0288594.1 hypothetical protein [Cryobacterium sp. 10S3]MEB0292382.1 hypothetical protein [Cryobacterium sp. 10C2]